MDIKVIQKTSESMIKKLPKGQRSQKSMERTASDMSKHMMKLVLGTPSEELTPNKYIELLYKVTYPVKPSLLINQIKSKSSDGALITRCKVQSPNEELYEKENICYELLLELKNGLIDLPKKVIIHESRHLFDMMCNHKCRVDRGLDALVKGNYSDKVFSWSGIRMELCDMTPPDKRAYEALLKSYSNTDKIDILRDVRYKIKSEINAYSDEDKMHLLATPFILRFFERGLVDLYSQKCTYKERLKIVENLLRKYIREERASLRCKTAGGAEIV